MASTFFVDWQMWQKMSFVLAIAIVIVFTAGLGKLWWTNRQNRKQETEDEEKRVKIEELRNSGLKIESSGDCGIPFGVRALESGLEVEGIWVSRPNTPIVENPNDLHGAVSPANQPLASSHISDSYFPPVQTPNVSGIGDLRSTANPVNRHLALRQISDSYSLHATTPNPEGLTDLRSPANSPNNRPSAPGNISFPSDSYFPQITTPNPEGSMNLHHSASSHSGSTSSQSTISPKATPKAILGLSRQSQGPPMRAGSPEISLTPTHLRDPSCNTAPSYKPRCASLLRFSSYGDMHLHEETLSQLQGQSPTQNEEVPSSIITPVGSQPPSPAATAENGLRSISLSDSESTICHKRPEDSRQKLRWASSESATHTMSKGKSPATKSNYISRPRIRRSREYTPVRPSSPQEMSDPFITPNGSPVLKPTSGANIQEPRRESHLLESQWPLLSQDDVEQQAGAGDGHANKLIRKVNSGFEVLPAGTFRTPTQNSPATSEEPYISEKSQENIKQKVLRKLQKKPRNSLPGSR